MAFEQKNNSGSLFKNTRKETADHPNATGSALIDGVDYWVSSWTKTDKNGNPWLSLSFKRKDDAQARKSKADDLRMAARGEPRGSAPVDIGDEIPFMRPDTP